MIMNIIGVVLLVLNAYYVWKDVKNDTISKGTLLNAAAVGCVFPTLLWIS
jgi:uncharacterized membrane protein